MLNIQWKFYDVIYCLRFTLISELASVSIYAGVVSDMQAADTIDTQ